LASIFGGIHRSSRAFNNHFSLHDGNEFMVIKRLLDLAVQTPNPRSKTPCLISSCRDGHVTSRAWRVIKSQRGDIYIYIYRSGPYVADWSHMINRDLARFNGAAACYSYLTVFPRHTFRNIPTCCYNEYQTLALYSQTSVICRRSRLHATQLHHRACTRDTMHAFVIRQISCSSARVPG